MLIVGVFGEYMATNREGGITLTRLGKWMSTNDGAIACALYDTVIVNN